MNRLFAVIISAQAILAVSNSANAQAHYHLHVAAAGKKQGDTLRFDDSDQISASHGFVSTLHFTNSGRFAGYFQGNLTTDVFSTSESHSAYSPDAPVPGSWIHLELASVEGPEGGSFGFWEVNAVAPTYSLVSGETGTNAWRIGENDGAPGSDPYGHIHGRRYT
ncbi:MAG TPA: hypothetical protein PKA41_09375, partial [Verrucomicrobiota bacterium]|nr:hypothetical protein [Verrucomicrobiota bacterium]